MFVSLLSATIGATSNQESLLDSSCRVALDVRFKNKHPASLSMFIVTNEIMMHGLVDTINTTTSSEIYSIAIQ